MDRKQTIFFNRAIITTGTKRLFLFVLLSVLISSPCIAESVQKISSSDKRLEYMGRTGKTDDAVVFSWPGTSVTVNFEGTDLAVKMRDEKGDNYYYVVVDNADPVKINPDTVLSMYQLAAHLKKGNHTVVLYKLTESSWGKTWIYDFELNEHAKVLPPAKRTRRIEFYGNSITAGYSVDDSVRDSKTPEYSNSYFSYAAITARHYKASYSFIAKSGIGLMLSWFQIIMPEMYDRQYEDDPTQKWNFKNYTPDIVVINLLQNDAKLMPKHDYPQFKYRFGIAAPDEKFIVNAYKDFIHSIRTKYPKATIICALGCMDAVKPGSPWPGYITKAVQATKDKKILTHFFAFNNSNIHPKRKGQQDMANDLIKFIDGHVKW